MNLFNCLCCTSRPISDVSGCFLLDSEIQRTPDCFTFGKQQLRIEALAVVHSPSSFSSLLRSRILLGILSLVWFGVSAEEEQ